MATAYDDFLSRVLPEVPGCPELAAIQALQDTTIEFCERSLIHQVDHDPISVVAKIADYDLESPVSKTRVTKVMKAFFKGNELIPAAPDQVRDPTIYNQRIGGTQTNHSDPRFFIQKDSASISLMPIPAESLASALTLRVALVPLRSATTCEDFLFEQWAEVIASGAVARLLVDSNRPYSNPRVAGIHQARFVSGINDAKQKANRGYNRSNLSVQMRRI
jgi:hypothetical protein